MFEHMTFKELVAHLEEDSAKRYKFLQYAQNPFIKRLDKLTQNEIYWVIQEYSQFSNESIHMLLDARLRCHEWTELVKEIDRNIEEEKGLETKGVPHLEIMRRGYQAEFGFDVNSYEPSGNTKDFLKEMKQIFRFKNEAYLAGALLAFETVSIPEFHILDALVAKYEAFEGTSRNEDVAAYIDGHKLFEVGHKEGLMRAAEPYIVTEYNKLNFRSGYLHVCYCMSEWWRCLNEKSK